MRMLVPAQETDGFHGRKPMVSCKAPIRKPMVSFILVLAVWKDTRHISPPVETSQCGISTVAFLPPAVHVFGDFILNIY